MEPRVDVEIRNDGTVFVFELVTPEAITWVSDNVSIPAYMWLGPRAFACEHRYAAHIAAGMYADGLEMR